MSLGNPVVFVVEYRWQTFEQFGRQFGSFTRRQNARLLSELLNSGHGKKLCGEPSKSSALCLNLG